MASRHRFFTATSCCLLISRVLAEATELCGILDQRTAIVGYRLYFSSGNYTFNDGQPWHNSSSFYALDLSKPVDVSGPIPLDSFEISDLPSDELAGGVGPIAGGAAGTFFYYHTTLYAYGSIIGGNANGTQNGLWTYNTTSEEWGLTIVEGGALSFGDDTKGVFANDPSQSLSFYTGGWEMAYNNNNNGIVRFDSSDPSQPQWNFQTAQGGTMQGPDILKGSMNFVRKGQAGILVAFGGYNTTHKGTEFAEGWDWDQRPFSDIFVYDIFSNVWYLVKATGDLPPLRSEFCSVVSSAPDDSSFQITMHGGWDQFYGIAYDDVWVLTLPAFEWIQVDAPSDVRNRHKCNMFLDNTQMIISGGGGGGNRCNQSYPPFKVLNTSTYTWQTHFQPHGLEFSVPDVVVKVVGGDSKGGATVKQPKAGWKNPELGTIFSRTLARDTYVYPSSSKNHSASGPSPKDGSSGTNTGAIAGGVVGGAVLLALIGFGIWFFRRRLKQLDNQPKDKSDNWMKPELGGHEVYRGSKLLPGELSPNSPPAQLETKTDRAEMDGYQYATAMQGVQSPVEMEAGYNGHELAPKTQPRVH